MASTSLPGADDELDSQRVVLRFLESVASPAESRFYLDLFRRHPREQFAAISIDAHVMRDAADAVLLDLRFLAALALFPTVVLGLFQPAEAASQARRLRQRLEAIGVECESLSAGDPDLVNRVAGSTRRGAVPVVAFDPVEDKTVEERFQALGRLLRDLATRKLIFLHRPGGLRRDGKLVPFVNVTADVPALLATKQLSRKETALLLEARRLVTDLARQRLVASIASPLDLLRELFTTKGAGTLLRRGAVILRHEGWTGVHRERIRDLLAISFGRPPVDAFFDRPVSRVHREEDYRGAAILVETHLGTYLSKFAVTPEAQGEGIARDLWDDVVRDAPVLFWRARAANPINEWYVKLADGLVRTEPTTVFWKGLAHERIAEAISWALAQPVDIPTGQPATG